MKRTLLTLALIAATGSAFATPCRDGSDPSQHPEGNCDWFYRGTDPSRPAVLGEPTQAAAGAAAGSVAGSRSGARADTRVIVDASGAPITAEQRQQQQQAQQQQVAATGGNATGTGAVRVGGTTVTGGTTVSNNRTEINSLYLPTFAPAPPLPPMIASTSNAVLSACMPRQEIWREPVYVLVRNSFWPDEMKQVGWDEFTKPAERAYKIVDVPVGYDVDGEFIYQAVPFGHQQLTKKEFQKAASGTSFNVAGIGKNGGGAVGGGDQGAVERWSTSIELFDCALEMKPAKVIEKGKAVLIETTKKRGNR